VLNQSDERRPAKPDVFDWVLRAALAVFFTSFGFEKVFAGPDSYWTTLFADIGLGQWFRYATGAVQLLGAALVLLPRTFLVGAALAGSTMVGAIFCHLFVLSTGVGGAIIPAVFLGFVIAATSRRLMRRRVDAPLVLR
jgi:putative oxidoreductase